MESRVEAPEGSYGRARHRRAEHEGAKREMKCPTRDGHLREPRAMTTVGVAGVALLVAVLVPLVFISAYNHSYADDWHYGVWAHLALQRTGNIGVALITALQQAGNAWFDWQGTYSAIFLMALEPSVFGEQFYVIAAPLVLASLIAGTFFFTHVVMVELLGAERGAWLGLSCVTVAVQLLLQILDVLFGGSFGGVLLFLFCRLWRLFLPAV